MLKNCKSLFVLIIAFFLSIGISFAQKEKSKEIKVINGVKYYMHTVAKGQTLFAIAKLYGQELNDIVIENPNAIDGISPGQVLKIIIEKKIQNIETIDSSKYAFHKVEKKETLFSISKKYGITIDQIKKINPELEAGLKEGKVIKLPFNEKTAALVKKNNLKDNIQLQNILPDTTKTTYIPKFKEQYNIAFFLPFHADQANELPVDKVINGDLQYSSKTKIAIQFYQGALMAIDSLKKQKLNAKIFVYDIDDNDSLYLQKILAKPEFNSMDLIIGPLYGSSFIPVSIYAKQHHIPIVSPFTQANKILFNNKYVCKISPSTSLQMEQVAHFVVDTFMNDNIVLVNTVNPKEISFYNAFKESATKLLINKGKTKSDSVKTAKGLSGVISLLDKNKINVIVLPSNNQSFVTDFISKLNVQGEKYKIVLFGMQSWTTFDNLDFEYLNNLSLHISDNNYIQYDSAEIKNFIKSYRLANNAEPEMFVFNGFDVTFYFISALQKYGISFLEKITEYTHKGISMNFEFFKFPTESGYENKRIFILKYKEYKLINAN